MIITDLDEAFAELIGYQQSNLLGRSVYDITHPDDLPANRRALDLLRNEGRPFAINKRYYQQNGEIVWVRNHVSRYCGTGQTAVLLATVEAIEKPKTPTISSLTAIAERIIDTRQKRSLLLDDILTGEPEFEVLLDLFVNEQRGRNVSISSACIASSAPTTTALRHVTRLISLGWLERHMDHHDKRRTNLTLSAQAYVRVVRYLELCERAEHSLPT